MIPFEELECSWHTTDGSDLHFSKPCEGIRGKKSYTSQPKEVTASIVGHYSLVNNGDAFVNLADVTFLKKFKGGLRASGRYTTEGQDWTAFSWKAEHSRSEILLAYVSGLGLLWFVVRQLSFYDTFLVAMEKLDNDQMWDFVSAIEGSLRQGTRHATNRTTEEYNRAFAEGRLKKRKERGTDRYKVWIEPSTDTP